MSGIGECVRVGVTVCQWVRGAEWKINWKREIEEKTEKIKEYKPPLMAKGILIIERLCFFSVLFLVSKSKLQSPSVISSTFPTLLKQMNWFKESRLFCESHPELCEFKLILKPRHGGEIRKWKTRATTIRKSPSPWGIDGRQLLFKISWYLFVCRR